MNTIITAEEVSIYGRPVSTDKTILDSTIREVEAEDIRPRLGDAMYTALMAALTDDRFTVLLEGGNWEDKAGRQRFCIGLKRAEAYFVYARVIRDGNIQATRFGAVNKDANYSLEPAIKERKRQYEEFFATADRYLKDCLLYLTANNCDFPEYTQGALMKSNRSRMRVVGDNAPTMGRQRSDQQITVIAGPAGESAYELAVRLGYRGTEEEWIESLHGKSIYQLAVERGYTGTEDEFVADYQNAVRAALDAAELAEGSAALAKEATDNLTEWLNLAKQRVSEWDEAETLREAAEKDRENAENLREDAETERQQAEIGRARTMEQFEAEVEQMKLDTAEAVREAEAARAAAAEAAGQALDASAAAREATLQAQNASEEALAAASRADEATEAVEASARRAEEAADAALRAEALAQEAAARADQAAQDATEAARVADIALQALHEIEQRIGQKVYGYERVTAAQMRQLIDSGTVNEGINYIVVYGGKVTAQYFGSTPIYGLELAVVGQTRVDHAAIA